MTTTAITTRGDDPPIVALLKQYGNDIEAALPAGWTGSRFQATAINLLRATPQLVNVDPMTFVASVLLSAQLGLEPGAPLGLSWIIPRRNKGKLEASFQLGANGLRELAYRSGLVSTVESRVVYEGDHFRYEHGSGGTSWEHRPSGEPGRQWTDVYAAARLTGGGELFEAMSRDEVLAHRDRYVPEWKSSKAWKEQEPEMGRKTVMARLARQLPKSPEVRSAMIVDGSSPRVLAPDLAGIIEGDLVDEDEGGESDG
jgi:recombination protein RecT